MIEFNYVNLTTGERHFIALCRFKQAPTIVTQNFLFHTILKQSIKNLDENLHTWRTYYTNPLNNTNGLSNKKLKEQIQTLRQALTKEDLATHYRKLAEKNVYINLNNFNDNNLICIRRLEDFPPTIRKKLEAHLPANTTYNTPVIKYSYSDHTTTDENLFTATTLTDSTLASNIYEMRGMVNHRLHTIHKTEHVQ